MSPYCDFDAEWLYLETRDILCIQFPRNRGRPYTFACNCYALLRPCSAGRILTYSNARVSVYSCMYVFTGGYYTSPWEDAGEWQPYASRWIDNIVILMWMSTRRTYFPTVEPETIDGLTSADIPLDPFNFSRERSTIHGCSLHCAESLKLNWHIAAYHR